MKQMKDTQRFKATNVHGATLEYIYVKKDKTIWHKIKSLSSGCILDVKDEWFEKRTICLVEDKKITKKGKKDDRKTIK